MSVVLGTEIEIGGDVVEAEEVGVEFELVMDGGAEVVGLGFELELELGLGPQGVGIGVQLNCCEDSTPGLEGGFDPAGARVGTVEKRLIALANASLSWLARFPPSSLPLPPALSLAATPSEGQEPLAWDAEPGAEVDVAAAVESMPLIVGGKRNVTELLFARAGLSTAIGSLALV